MKKGTTMARRRRRSTPARRKSRRRGSGGRLSFKEKRNVTLASAALGYLEENTEMMQSIPGADMKPVKKRLVYGIALHLIAKHVGGSSGKYADYASAAYLMRGAWDLGAKKLSLEGIDDDYDEVDADEVSGVIEG